MIDEKFIAKLINKINRILKKEKNFKKILNHYNTPQVFVCSPQLMRSLEKKFFKKNKEPDILSFNWPKNFPSIDKKPPLGEIYLNKKVLKDKQYLKRLLVHGFLHLLGFTHFKKSDSIKMEKKEAQILNYLNKNGSNLRG